MLTWVFAWMLEMPPCILLPTTNRRCTCVSVAGYFSPQHISLCSSLHNEILQNNGITAFQIQRQILQMAWSMHFENSHRNEKAFHLGKSQREWYWEVTQIWRNLAMKHVQVTSFFHTHTSQDIFSLSPKYLWQGKARRLKNFYVSCIDIFAVALSFRSVKSSISN